MAAQPVLFLGHGNPMNAITQNPYRAAWAEIGRALPRPEAILCVSAHWLTQGPQVTMADPPRTIHDFGGFPAELFAQQYPAPGAPRWARRTQALLERVAEVREDHAWGIDHGAWCVLASLFPAAGVPVYQLSLDVTLPAAGHLALARELRPLRDEGVLIVASGNVVHNLRRVDWQPGATVPDWALEFDDWVRTMVEQGDGASLAEHERLSAASRLAVPTPDHYWPLLYAMGVAQPEEPVTWPVEGFDLGNISMRSARWH